MSSPDAPGVVSPTGVVWIGNSWTEVVELPSHATNPDGTQGAALDWSGSTFTVETTGGIAALPVTVTFDSAARTVTLSATATATAALKPSTGRWYLRENVVMGGNDFLARAVVVEGRS